MADNVLKTIIQVRRDSTDNWLLHKDFVPAAGEPCLDLDTGILKFGDGITTYENLKETGASTNQNVIEIIKLAGTPLVVDLNKSVDIPIATMEVLGLVRGTDAENGVSIAENGSMSVNEVNVNKLTQTDEEQLILDGGNSNV